MLKNNGNAEIIRMLKCQNDQSIHASHENIMMVMFASTHESGANDDDSNNNYANDHDNDHDINYRCALK